MRRNRNGRKRTRIGTESVSVTEVDQGSETGTVIERRSERKIRRRSVKESERRIENGKRIGSVRRRKTEEIGIGGEMMTANVIDIIEAGLFVDL